MLVLSLGEYFDWPLHICVFHDRNTSSIPTTIRFCFLCRYLVSDCDSVGGFGHFPPHPDAVHAAAMGVLGGLDVDCGGSYVTCAALLPFESAVSMCL